jgi:hypothetical protein
MVSNFISGAKSIDEVTICRFVCDDVLLLKIEKEATD